MKKNILLALTISLLAGCQYSDNPVDPYEEYNRKVFAFNEQADQYVIGPVVSVYRAVLPSPFRMGINNFYANVSEISYAVNFGLQGQWEDCYHSGIRLVVNSLFGVGGIFDMAHDLGLPRKRNDFGKTLYSWGYTESPYSVSPFFGPSTVRDMGGFCVDKMLLNPLVYF
jgi:phospholipid-binding lipoprotein MlaA